MADFQYRPNVSDPVTRLRTAMQKMDGMFSSKYQGHISAEYSVVNFLKDYVIPSEREDYTNPDSTAPTADGLSGPPVCSNLRMFAPPIFSRQTIFQNYKWARIRKVLYIL